jgi:DNA-binding GntR family transcriptional regulator
MAIRRLIEQGNPEHLEALKQNIQDMKSAAGATGLADLDLDFHELLIRLSGHRRLLACWQSLRTQIKLLMVTHNLRNPRSVKSTIQNHTELLSFIEAGDADGAVAHNASGNLVHLTQALSE